MRLPPLSHYSPMFRLVIAVSATTFLWGCVPVAGIRFNIATDGSEPSVVRKTLVDVATKNGLESHRYSDSASPTDPFRYFEGPFGAQWIASFQSSQPSRIYAEAWVRRNSASATFRLSERDIDGKGLSSEALEVVERLRRDLHSYFGADRVVEDR
jgi:hypothetical protein